MWRWCAYLLGLMLIGVALAALPSVPIVESYVGGSAVHGFIEDGRYFVNPGHGQPIVEVAESTWRTVYWLERIWPWSALIPIWLGMFLTFYGKGPNWKPPPVPPGELPACVFRACLVHTGITVGGTLAFWYTTRVPWATMLVAWVLFCICCAAVTRVYSRFLRQQSAAESDTASGSDSDRYQR